MTSASGFRSDPDCLALCFRADFSAYNPAESGGRTPVLERHLVVSWAVHHVSQPSVAAILQLLFDPPGSNNLLVTSLLQSWMKAGIQTLQDVWPGGLELETFLSSEQNI